MTTHPRLVLAPLLALALLLAGPVAEAQATSKKAADAQAEAYAEVQARAERGNAQAQYELGAAHEYGRGTPPDPAQAAQWYRRAAEQGHAIAQGRLGMLLAMGRGVAQDEAQAVSWWRRGAAQGDADSQGRLGIACYDGAGVPVDKPLSYQWLLLAAAQPGPSQFRYQRFRDRVEQELNAAQRTAAEEAARRFVAQPGMPTTPVAPPQGPLAGTPAGVDGGQPSGPPVAQLPGNGTAFVVAPGRLLTAWHVVRDCRRLAVDGGGNVAVLASEPANDLALLAAPGLRREPAPLRTDGASVGETATVAGYPLARLLGSFSIAPGIVSSLAGMQGDSRMLQFSASAQPGHSGGPVVDGQGQVLGMVVGALDAQKVARIAGATPQNVNFALAAPVMAAFLSAQGVQFHGVQGSPATALALPEVARRAQNYTLLIECWR
jgi:S1-C subfamily serine protease